LGLILQTNSIKLRLEDIKSLATWAEDLGPRNIPVEIKVTPHNLGYSVVVYAETDEGSGVWKDITHYENL
jgi:hypothetical protein